MSFVWLIIWSICTGILAGIGSAIWEAYCRNKKASK